MPFEKELSALNEWHFFKEFVYSSTTFRPRPATEMELADNLVWLGGIVFAFQLKERDPQPSATEETERRWFERKVLGNATRQVRDTVSYLGQIDSVRLTNARGHEQELKPSQIETLHKLIVYLPQPPIPNECLEVKYHISQTAGFMHIMPGNDYLGIVGTLLTPAEVSDYLQFRERLIRANLGAISAIPEPAMVGQYLSGDHDAAPSHEFLEYLRTLEQRADEWDISGIIKNFTQRTTHSTGPTHYYFVIRELALLKRHELKEFKLRYRKALEFVRANKFALPFRMVVPRTGCGFVIIPITLDVIEHRGNGLQNFTMAHKYDQKLNKCVGVVIAADSGPWFLSDWCYIETPWEPDPEMEALLKKSNPFRSVSEKELPMYVFSGREKQD
jgi:hypothetical protein